MFVCKLSSYFAFTLLLQRLVGLVALVDGTRRLRGTDCAVALQILLLLRPQPEGVFVLRERQQVFVNADRPSACEPTVRAGQVAGALRGTRLN